MRFSKKHDHGQQLAFLGSLPPHGNKFPEDWFEVHADG
jgi:hypothetical protein